MNAPFSVIFKLLNQLKSFHWITTSYSTHKAIDKTYNSLLESTDRFMEVYLGKYGRPKTELVIHVEVNVTSTNYIDFIDRYIEYFVDLNNQLDSTKDTDLLNIRDEILGDLNRLKYFLTLK